MSKGKTVLVDGNAHRVLVRVKEDEGGGCRQPYFVGRGRVDGPTVGEQFGEGRIELELGGRNEDSSGG